MKTTVTSISFIEHLLAIPKTPGKKVDEFTTERLDAQPRSIDLDDFSNDSFVDK